MAFGKWSMYVGAVVFLIIGLGALAVAFVPGADEWVAEQTLDATGASDTFDRFDDGEELNETAVGILTDDDIGGVRTTSLILAATFLPTAALFVFIGRWFTSMESGFDAMVQSVQMAHNPAAVFPQYGQPPVPGFHDPMAQPPPG